MRCIRLLVLVAPHGIAHESYFHTFFPGGPHGFAKVGLNTCLRRASRPRATVTALVRYPPMAPTMAASYEIAAISAGLYID